MFTNNKAFPLNFATSIAAIDPLAAVEFGCLNVCKCTTEELFAKQFLNGTISNKRPGALVPSSFLGTSHPNKCASIVWNDWGTD